MVKVAINGFGRIGRLALRKMMEQPEKFQIVAINDLTDSHMLAHLLKYDSSQGRFNGEVVEEEGAFVVNGQEILVISERNPENLPWGEMGVDIVLECTGLFTSKEKAEAHIKAGAKKVLISAPATGDVKTIVYNVNSDIIDGSETVVSGASCTTNCLAPVAKVIDEEFGIENGMMTTVHAYTNDQQVLDKSHKDLRRSRACGASIIPTTTGAAKAVALVLPQLKGKLNGFSLRVPTQTVSIVDLVVNVRKKDITAEEVNAALKKASEGELKGILGYSDKPLVSVDYKGDERSSIVDGLSTMVMDNGLVKILSWYDNEWGYATRTHDLVNIVSEKMK